MSMAYPRAFASSYGSRLYDLSGYNYALKLMSVPTGSSRPAFSTAHAAIGGHRFSSPVAVRKQTL